MPDVSSLWCFATLVRCRRSVGVGIERGSTEYCTHYLSAYLSIHCLVLKCVCTLHVSTYCECTASSPPPFLTSPTTIHRLHHPSFAPNTKHKRVYYFLLHCWNQGRGPRRGGNTGPTESNLEEVFNNRQTGKQASR